MDFKKVLIGVAVIGVAYYFYNKSKKSTSEATTTTDTESSNANGAQLLAVMKGGSTKGSWNGASGRTGRTCFCPGIGNVYTTNDNCYGVCQGATSR